MIFSKHRWVPGCSFYLKLWGQTQYLIVIDHDCNVCRGCVLPFFVARHPVHTNRVLLYIPTALNVSLTLKDSSIIKINVFLPVLLFYFSVPVLAVHYTPCWYHTVLVVWCQSGQSHKGRVWALKWAALREPAVWSWRLLITHRWPLPYRKETGIL